MPPIDEPTAVAKLREAEVPPAIVDVARHLQDAGHVAVLVGGAVRDVLLDLPASDWDLASSATPDEVMRLFRRTIPTGIQHGTVTVLVREGETTHPVEITTFRGEGEYVDGRRPTVMRFLDRRQGRRYKRADNKAPARRRQLFREPEEHDRRQRDPFDLYRLLRQKRPRGRRLLAARAAQ